MWLPKVGLHAFQHGVRLCWPHCAVVQGTAVFNVGFLLDGWPSPSLLPGASEHNINNVEMDTGRAGAVDKVDFLSEMAGGAASPLTGQLRPYKWALPG